MASRRAEEGGTACAPGETPPLRLALHRLNGRRVFGEAVPLPEEGAVLGNDSADTLPGLDLDASVMVARTHARIIPLCGHWMLSLADERMVCAVNGHKVPWGELYTLQAGDSIQLGFAELRVESAASDGAHALDFLAGMDSVPVPAAQSAQCGAVHTPMQSTAGGVAHSIPSPPAAVEGHSSSGLASSSLASSSHDCSGHVSSGHDNLRNHSGGESAENAPFSHDEEDDLNPAEALLRQLDADFSASATGRALHYQWGGQPLDAILGPEPPFPSALPDLPGLPGLPGLAELPELAGLAERAELAEHVATAPPDDDRAFFAQLAQTAPQYPTHFPVPCFAASAPTPAPTPAPNPDLYSADALPKPPPFLPPPQSSTASPVPPAPPSSPLPGTDPLPPLSPNDDSPLSLEDILDGPLHIDDVLRGLGDNPGSLLAGTDKAALFSLDVLQEEVPPDPLSLLPPCAEQKPLASPALYPPQVPPLTGRPAAWPGLSPLLQREHHQSGLHSPYTLTTTPKDTEPA